MANEHKQRKIFEIKRRIAPNEKIHLMKGLADHLLSQVEPRNLLRDQDLQKVDPIVSRNSKEKASHPKKALVRVRVLKEKDHPQEMKDLLMQKEAVVHSEKGMKVKPMIDSNQRVILENQVIALQSLKKMTNHQNVSVKAPGSIKAKKPLVKKRVDHHHFGKEMKINLLNDLNQKVISKNQAIVFQNLKKTMNHRNVLMTSHRMEKGGSAENPKVLSMKNRGSQDQLTVRQEDYKHH
ncbi:MAG TPA: hypothetical protein DGG95_12385, partial [Cytophagales bacterium]|nr:hypothetical protein [Cytophagales bacterium]